MQVLFAIIPGHGHFFPYLPLATALIRSGHKVRFATSASYGDTVRKHGFEAVAVGLDYTQGSVEFDDEDTDPVEKLMFADGPPVMLADMLRHLEESPVDVLLVDPTEMGSMVAAEAAGIAWGSVVPGRRNGFLPAWVPFDAAERNSSFVFQMRSLYARMCDSVGLEPKELLLGEAPYDRTFSLCMAPESFNGWSMPAQHHTSHPLRPEVHISDTDDSWLNDIADDAPLVAVSFGTLFGSPDLYAEAAAAVLGTGANVVVSTSYDIALEHQRLTKVRWVSMNRLMARADVFVHHAGWGSTVASLATGTPSVTVPIGADQFTNAQAFTNTGAGVTVPRASVAESLGDAVTRVLEDDVYRLSAERLRAEVDAMPGASECVPLVERLAEEGVIFNKPMG